MGASATKHKSDAVLPIVQISIKMLTSQPTKSQMNIKNKINPNDSMKDSSLCILPKISSRLCGKILKNCSKDQLCSTEDVDRLKDYLNSDFNSYKYDLNSRKFIHKTISSKTELNKFLRRREDEFIQIIDKDKYPHKTLSKSASKELKSILKQLNSKTVCSRLSLLSQFNVPENPRLLNDIIRPQLENAYMINQQRSKYGKRLTYGILEKYNDILLELEEAFIKQKLTASQLRQNLSMNRNMKGTRSLGMDRAHKVSLKLAVILWKKVYGHDLAYARVRVQLRQALSLPSNIYVTCHHTNRVLHVKYDNEIINALQRTEKQNTLSPGAKMRLKQVLDTLFKLKVHSDVMNDFANRSIAVLKNIS